MVKLSAGTKSRLNKLCLPAYLPRARTHLPLPSRAPHSRLSAPRQTEGVRRRTNGGDGQQVAAGRTCYSRLTRLICTNGNSTISHAGKQAFDMVAEGKRRNSRQILVHVNAAYFQYKNGQNGLTQSILVKPVTLALMVRRYPTNFSDTMSNVTAHYMLTCLLVGGRASGSTQSSALSLPHHHRATLCVASCSCGRLASCTTYTFHASRHALTFSMPLSSQRLMGRKEGARITQISGRSQLSRAARTMRCYTPPLAQRTIWIANKFACRSLLIIPRSLVSLSRAVHLPIRTCLVAHSRPVARRDARYATHAFRRAFWIHSCC